MYYAPITISRRDDVAGGGPNHTYMLMPRKSAPCPGPHRTLCSSAAGLDSHVGPAVEQFVETCAEDDARAAAVPGCTARRAVAIEPAWRGCGALVACGARAGLSEQLLHSEEGFAAWICTQMEARAGLSALSSILSLAAVSGHAGRRVDVALPFPGR